jgi:hypothetical protein
MPCAPQARQPLTLALPPSRCPARQNPRHDKEAPARLQKHAEDKRAAAAKDSAHRSTTDAVIADEARAKEIEVNTTTAELTAAVVAPALEAAEEGVEEAVGPEGMAISLQLIAGVQLDVCVTCGAEPPSGSAGA